MKLVSQYSGCGGFPYKSESICYIEVKADGTVQDFPHRCECDLTFVKDAHCQALYKGSIIYAALAFSHNFPEMYEIDDLGAFAKAFSLKPNAGHTHSFYWSAKDLSLIAGGESVWVTIKMQCGCVLNERNLSDFAQLMHKRLGWEVVLSSGVSNSTDSRGIGKNFLVEVLRNSLRTNSGKFNIAKKSYF